MNKYTVTSFHYTWLQSSEMFEYKSIWCNTSYQLFLQTYNISSDNFIT